MLYVFDTNSLRVLRSYFPERFPSFWSRFEAAVDSEEIRSVREVYNELSNQAVPQWLMDWFSARREMFLAPESDETAFVRRIFEIPHFRALIGSKQRLLGYPVADPFVIACAHVRGGCVVTEEAFKENAAKIPNVCSHFGVPYTDVEGFLQAVDWQF